MSAVVLSILGAAMIAIPVAATAAQAAPDTESGISVPLPAPAPLVSAPGHTIFVDPGIGVCVNCLLADISL